MDDEALKGIPLMVLANKQDLVNAMAAGDVSTARLLFPLAVGMAAADGSAHTAVYTVRQANAAKVRSILSGGFGAGVGKPEGPEMADSGPKHAPCAGSISPARARRRCSRRLPRPAPPSATTVAPFGFGAAEVRVRLAVQCRARYCTTPVPSRSAGAVAACRRAQPSRATD